MFSLTFRFTAKVLDGINQELNEWYGVKLTEAQLKKLVSENLTLLDNIDFEEGGFNGTSGRELMIDEICGLVGSGPWPTYADGDSKKFMEKFKRLAKAHRIKVTV